MRDPPEIFETQGRHHWKSNRGISGPIDVLQKLKKGRVQKNQSLLDKGIHSSHYANCAN